MDRQPSQAVGFGLFEQLSQTVALNEFHDQKGLTIHLQGFNEVWHTGKIEAREDFDFFLESSLKHLLMTVEISPQALDSHGALSLQIETEVNLTHTAGAETAIYPVALV